MPVLEHAKPCWPAVQVQCVAVQMIVWAYKIRIRITANELNHKLELAGQIEIIILGKINEFGVFLLQQDFYLPVEGAMVADPRQWFQNKVFRSKDPAEHFDITGWTAI